MPDKWTDTTAKTIVHYALIPAKLSVTWMIGLWSLSLPAMQLLIISYTINNFWTSHVRGPLCYVVWIILPNVMSKTLLMTVRKARWKRHVKDILGCVDSSHEISDTSVTGSSATCPNSLHKHTHKLGKESICNACNQYLYVLPYPNILSCSDDPFQGSMNKTFKFLILSLNKKHEALLRGCFGIPFMTTHV